MIKSFIISMITSIFLITILNVFLNNNSKSLKKKIGWQHYFFGYLFILYLMVSLTAVVGFPSLSQLQRLSRLNEPMFNPIINLVPFNDGIEISSILNIIFFMPFGFLLPTLWKKYRKLLPTLCTGLLFSIIIEIGQLFVGYRASDINDLIMNTIGTICGWISFNIISKIFHKLANKTVVEISSNDSMTIKLEPYLYIAIAIISTFLG
ncbi:VanZ family protein [Clostridium estertheticum]|uniref:VanZ family protein n=1 Tax=Clostridium estertheticum TaxID=238834 RepID=UPI0013EE5A5F|nr:VanZ family protein [Clostridium estertheticum]MBZ9607929.1 VanZ family protein [Clostridium estertheticum]